MCRKMLIIVLTGSAWVLFGAAAEAQEPVVPPPPPPVALPPPPPPVAAPPAPAPPADEMSDHERISNGKHFAVGYFGLNNLPIGAGTPAAPTRANVVAPVVGVRYWLNHRVGFDIGVGLGFTSPSQETVMGGTTTDGNFSSPFGFAIHGGVPIALAWSKHFTFEVVPEANLGFTTATLSGNGGADTNYTGFHFDVGARAGAEIQFGFIGIPQLALEGSIGLYVTRETVKVSQDPNSGSVGTTTFGTTVGTDPWALFVNRISALYYF